MEPLPNCRILLVEDQAAVRRLVARMLRSAGCQVEETKDGWEALKYASQEGFDLVITDSHMPGMTGPELIARLRSLYPDIRIIRMSGSSPEAETAEGVPTDIPTLFKPFQQEQLIEEVSRLLTARSSSN